MFVARVGRLARSPPADRARTPAAPRAIRTGTAALEGANAVVLQRVDGDGGPREDRRRGVERPLATTSDEVFEPGARVEVAEIEGATALVYG